MYFKFYLEDDNSIWSQGYFNDAENLLKEMLKDFTSEIYNNERNAIISLYGEITIESIKKYYGNQGIKLELYKEDGNEF